MAVKMKTLIFVQHGTVTGATTLTPAVTTPMPQMARQARQKALALQQRAEWHQRLPGPTQPPHQQNNLQQAPAAGRRKTMANGPVQVLPQWCRACTCANGYHPADCTDGEDEDAGFCEKWNNVRHIRLFGWGVRVAMLALAMTALAMRTKPKPRRNV